MTDTEITCSRFWKTRPCLTAHVWLLLLTCLVTSFVQREAGGDPTSCLLLETMIRSSLRSTGKLCPLQQLQLRTEHIRCFFSKVGGKPHPARTHAVPAQVGYVRDTYFLAKFQTKSVGSKAYPRPNSKPSPNICAGLQHHRIHDYVASIYLSIVAQETCGFGRPLLARSQTTWQLQLGYSAVLFRVVL